MSTQSKTDFDQLKRIRYSLLDELNKITKELTKIETAQGIHNESKYLKNMSISNSSSVCNYRQSKAKKPVTMDKTLKLYEIFSGFRVIETDISFISDESCYEHEYTGRVGTVDFCVSFVSDQGDFVNMPSEQNVKFDIRDLDVTMKKIKQQQEMQGCIDYIQRHPLDYSYLYVCLRAYSDLTKLRYDVLKEVLDEHSKYLSMKSDEQKQFILVCSRNKTVFYQVAWVITWNSSGLKMENLFETKIVSKDEEFNEDVAPLVQNLVNFTSVKHRDEILKVFNNSIVAVKHLETK